MVTKFTNRKACAGFLFEVSGSAKKGIDDADVSNTGTELTAIGLGATMALSIGSASAASQIFNDRAPFEAVIAGIANVTTAVED